MGGKALNRFGVFTERKNTAEFKQIGYELNVKIFFDLTFFTSVVTCYRNKADHGDLDLLIRVLPYSNINWVEYIQNTFKPQAVNSNGGVYSFDYKNFQIDFIPIPEEKWNTALVYFSYDPLGNIMGKTFHKFGCSYGWEGLFYKYHNPHGSVSADILLSNDVRKIFNFGGYDYDRYLKGFDTLEEIFQFCIDGKYFDSEMFQMENLKSLDKKRNRKRGSYHLFLNYIKEKGINTKYPFNEDKDIYLEAIETAFPESELGFKLRGLRLNDALNQKISEKFNGEIVMSWFPRLKGKVLGKAMGKFKDCLGVNYDDFILNSSIEDIKYYFMKVYNGKE
jgi:hypothetical protein